MGETSQGLFKSCFRQIEDLFAKNKLREAFNMLDQCLEDTGMDLTDPSLMQLTSQKTVLSASFHRVQGEYRLGTIEWEKYDLSGTRIVEQSLVLAQKLCTYLARKKSKQILPDMQPSTQPSLPTRLQRYFKKMITKKEIEERPPAYRIDTSASLLREEITYGYQQLIDDIQVLLHSKAPGSERD